MNNQFTGRFHSDDTKRTPFSFHGLGLSQPLLRALDSEGYETPTPVQAEAIPYALQGQDVLACAQTGTGKTAAFALPILNRLITLNASKRAGIRALILAPTRELAIQIEESIEAYGRFTAVGAAVIYGGVGQQSQIRALKRGVDILVATPGRLLDLIGQGYVDLQQIEVFVLDEADRMLDMGFIHDVRRIVQELPPARQNLLFSATMPAEVRRLAGAILHRPVEVQVAAPSARAEGVEQTVYFIEKTAKLNLLCRILGEDATTRTLVFTRTKHGADKLVRHLARTGIRAEAIHGNKAQAARQRALETFRSTERSVLVATDLAARGLDVDSISHVVNFDMPHEPETYVHRIGRTARAGAPGIALSFCDFDERPYLRAVERLIREPIPVMGDGGREVVPAPATTRSQVVYRTRRRARR